ncbi:DUF3077 domain-containing protein [Stutzerimonas degradans]
MSRHQTTPGCHFHSTGEVSQRQFLFAVVPDVPARDALQSASDLLSATEDSIFAAAMGEQPLEDNAAWLVFHSLKSAKAVIESVLGSMEGAL